MEQYLERSISQQSLTGNAQRSHTARIFAVVVLYKMHPHDSPTLHTLVAARQEAAHLDIQILVWDNTPGGQNPGQLPPEVFYESAPSNPGLACAYNHAVYLASAQRYDWLLTLDQDSALPPNFINRMAELAQQLHLRSEVCAIVPQVTGDGRNLSPFVLALGWIPKWFAYGYEGLPTSTTYAVNSAALLRIDALLSIDGYDPLLPLDISDLNLFHRLGKAGRKVYVAGDLLVQHNFSLLNKAGRMSIQRYDAMLLDECFFWDTQMGMLARTERLVRLAGRFCRDLMRGQNAAFRDRTLTELWRRLTTSRRKRIDQWRQWAAARQMSSEAERRVKS